MNCTTRNEINLIQTSPWVTSNTSPATITSTEKVKIYPDWTDPFNLTPTFEIRVIAKVDSGSATITINGITLETNQTFTEVNNYITISSTSYAQSYTFFTGLNGIGLKDYDGDLYSGGFFTAGVVLSGTYSNLSIVSIKLIKTHSYLNVYAIQQHVDMGQQTTSNSITAVPLTYPKYWAYSSSNWDPIPTKFTFYGSLYISNTGGTGYVLLQKSNDWTTWATVPGTTTSLTGTSTTDFSLDFVPENNYHYRVAIYCSSTMYSVTLYNAYIIINQNSMKIQEQCSSGAYSLNLNTTEVPFVVQTLTPTYNWTCTGAWFCLPWFNGHSPFEGYVSVYEGSMSNLIAGSSRFRIWEGNRVTFTPFNVIVGKTYYFKIWTDLPIDNLSPFQINLSSTNSLSGKFYSGNSLGELTEMVNYAAVSDFIGYTVAIKKTEGAYSFNGINSGIGLQLDSVAWDYNPFSQYSTDWKGCSSIIFNYSIDSDNSSNSSKLTNITPNLDEDIINSTATGANQSLSSPFNYIAPNNTETHLLKANVLNSTGVISTSRILVFASIPQNVLITFINIANSTASLNLQSIYCSSSLYPNSISSNANFITPQVGSTYPNGGYEIYRAIDNGNYELYEIIGLLNERYDYNVDLGNHLYSYKIKKFFEASHSEYSNTYSTSRSINIIVGSIMIAKTYSLLHRVLTGDIVIIPQIIQSISLMTSPIIMNSDQREIVVPQILSRAILLVPAIKIDVIIKIGFSNSIANSLLQKIYFSITVSQITAFSNAEMLNVRIPVYILGNFSIANASFIEPKIFSSYFKIFPQQLNINDSSFGIGIETLDINIAGKINSYDLFLWNLNGNFIKTLHNSEQFKGQAFNTIMKDNINGQKSLTFSIPLYILDEDNYTIIENPLWENIDNEQKIRLVLNRKGLKEKIHDFIIKKYTELISDNLPIMEIECQDAAMCELNKIALTFNTNEKADIGIIYSEFPPLKPGRNTIWVNYDNIFKKWVPVPINIVEPPIYYGPPYNPRNGSAYDLNTGEYLEPGGWIFDSNSVYVDGSLPSIYYGNQIALGWGYSLFVKKDASLWGAGRNRVAELGILPWVGLEEPNYLQQTGIGTTWKNVSAHYGHSLAIKSDGALYGTGYNHYGQLGLGTFGTLTPGWIRIGILNNWKKVLACGADTTFVQQTSGIVLTSGRNEHGELGIGNNINQSVFTIVNGMSFSQLSGGWAHTVGISNGKLYSTGDNSSGQLGLGDWSNRNSFSQIGTDNDWVQVSAGMDFTIALKSNGTLWGCGCNEMGRFGYTTYAPEGYNFWPSLVLLSVGGKKYNSISAGYYHSLAIRNDGALCVTGVNGFGALGLPDYNWVNGYYQVGTSFDWLTVFGGNYSSFARKKNGAMYVSGRNDYGQSCFPNDTSNKSTFTYNPNINNLAM